MNRVIAGLLVIVLALALAGCGGGEDKAEVSVGDDSVTVKTDDGQATISGGEGKLAEGFPEEFPIYDGADIESSAVVTANGQTHYTATLVTSDSVTDVYNWYKAQLTSNGWTIRSDAQVNTGDGASSMLSAEKDAMQANMGATLSDGKTSIAIGITATE